MFLQRALDEWRNSVSRDERQEVSHQPSWEVEEPERAKGRGVMEAESASRRAERRWWLVAGAAVCVRGAAGTALARCEKRTAPRLRTTDIADTAPQSQHRGDMIPLPMHPRAFE